MKKVFKHTKNMWHFTKYNGVFLECDYCYVLCLELHDHIVHLENVIAFDDAAIELLGVTTKDLCPFQESQTPSETSPPRSNVIISFSLFLLKQTLSMMLNTFSQPLYTMRNTLTTLHPPLFCGK